MITSIAMAIPLFLKSLSLEDRIKIRKMLDEGFSYREMGLELDRSGVSIRNEVQRKGGRLNYDPQAAHERYTKNIKNVLNGRKTRYLTYDERKKIEECLRQHISYPEIAKLINRSLHTIRNEIAKHGPKDSYNADSAHKKHNENLQQRSLKLRTSIREDQIEVMKEGFSKNYSLERIRAMAGIGKDKFLRWYRDNLETCESWKTEFISQLDRINALEQQMEIIMDLIKEMK